MTERFEYTIRLRTGEELKIEAEDIIKMHIEMKKRGHARGTYDVRGWMRLDTIEQEDLF